MRNWYTTDELQQCKDLGNRKYKFIQAIWIDTCPKDPENEYCVCSGIVDLNEWVEEDTETAIVAYYGSIDDMLENYGACSLQELDDIVAECIFEENFFTDSNSHGTFNKDGAVDFIKKWIKEN